MDLLVELETTVLTTEGRILDLREQMEEEKEIAKADELLHIVNLLDVVRKLMRDMYMAGTE